MGTGRARWARGKAQVRASCSRAMETAPGKELGLGLVLVVGRLVPRWDNLVKTSDQEWERGLVQDLAPPRAFQLMVLWSVGRLALR